MIKFTTTILKFEKKAEKTGWTYIDIPATQAKKLKDSKVTFRVKGSLDQYAFEKIALLPMGEGHFILPINATMRKNVGKREGEKLTVTLALDESKRILSPDLMACLEEDHQAMTFFKSLAPSHQQYFSNWIESAKTTQTKTKRIVMAVIGLSKKQDYGEMIRSNKTTPFN